MLTGNVATADDQTFTTKAGDSILSVKVIDQKNNPVEGANVIIGHNSGKTDKSGKVTLSGLASGQSTVVIDFNGHKTTKKIDVDPPTGAAQSVTLSILTSKNYLPIIILPAVGLLVLVAGTLFLGRGVGGSGSRLPFSGSTMANNVTTIGSTVGSTPTPGVAVVPPPPSSSNNTKTKTKPNAEEENFDPTNNPPPPTIVRPTIPPRT
jgi:hypothetical protein